MLKENLYFFVLTFSSGFFILMMEDIYSTYINLYKENLG